MCTWIICMQVSWETATPWSTLPSWCRSFVSLPDRARRWRQTSSTSGWLSGEEPAVFLVILNLGSSKAKTQDTNIFLAPVTTIRLLCQSSLLEGVQLTWAGFSPRRMEQMGQKVEHWAAKEVILLQPFSTNVFTDRVSHFTVPLCSPPRPGYRWSAWRIMGLIPGGSWLIPGSI